MCTCFKYSYVLCLTFLLMRVPVLATDFQAGERVNVNTPQREDLYLAGSEIHVDATVGGDIVAAGGEIYIRDSVRVDLIAAGGEINISGYVGDDLRAAGGKIELSGYITGDTIVAGGELLIGRDAVISGDLVIAGGEVEIQGTVGGKMIVRGGQIIFTGKVSGPLDAKAGAKLMIDGQVGGESTLAANEIELGGQALFSGPVRYWHRAGEIDFGDALDGVEATFDTELESEIRDVEWEMLGRMWIMSWVARILGALLLIALLMWAFPSTFTQSGAWVNQEFFRSTGWGLAYAIGLPVACFILCMIIIGIPIGLFGTFFYAFSLLFSHVLATIVFTEAANYRYERNWNRTQIIFVSWAMYVGIKIISWIPFVGWLIAILAALAAIGALIHVIFNRSKSAPVQK